MNGGPMSDEALANLQRMQQEALERRRMELAEARADREALVKKIVEREAQLHKLQLELITARTDLRRLDEAAGYHHGYLEARRVNGNGTGGLP